MILKKIITFGLLILLNERKIISPRSLFFSLNIFSQILYEEGYFITNEGIQTEAFIKNVDWKNNPTTFEFKVTGNSESEAKTMEQVKEFGIYNKSKFIKKTVELDRSSDHINLMSQKRVPEYSNETLLLKEMLLYTNLRKGN